MPTDSTDLSTKNPFLHLEEHADDTTLMRAYRDELKQAITSIPDLTLRRQVGHYVGSIIALYKLEVTTAQRAALQAQQHGERAALRRAAVDAYNRSKHQRTATASFALVHYAHRLEEMAFDAVPPDPPTIEAQRGPVEASLSGEAIAIAHIAGSGLRGVQQELVLYESPAAPEEYAIGAITREDERGLREIRVYLGRDELAVLRLEINDILNDAPAPPVRSEAAMLREQLEAKELDAKRREQEAEWNGAIRVLDQLRVLASDAVADDTAADAFRRETLVRTIELIRKNGAWDTSHRKWMEATNSMAAQVGDLAELLGIPRWIADLWREGLAPLPRRQDEILRRVHEEIDRLLAGSADTGGTVETDATATALRDAISNLLACELPRAARDEAHDARVAAEKMIALVVGAEQRGYQAYEQADKDLTNDASYQIREILKGTAGDGVPFIDDAVRRALRGAGQQAVRDLATELASIRSVADCLRHDLPTGPWWEHAPIVVAWMLRRGAAMMPKKSRRAAPEPSPSPEHPADAPASDLCAIGTGTCEDGEHCYRWQHDADHPCCFCGAAPETVTLHAWLKMSDAHGVVGYAPIWLPSGVKPEIDPEKMIRAPWLDGRDREVEPAAMGAISARDIRSFKKVLRDAAECARHDVDAFRVRAAGGPEEQPAPPPDCLVVHGTGCTAVVFPPGFTSDLRGAIDSAWDYLRKRERRAAAASLRHVAKLSWKPDDLPAIHLNVRADEIEAGAYDLELVLREPTQEK